MENCIFCKISDGKIPAHLVFEDAKVIAFLDINPKTKGHTVVIPREHFEKVEDVPDELLSSIIRTMKKIGGELKKSLPCEAYNIVQNNGKLAGQEVAHIHFHLIPRYDGDNGGIAFKSSTDETKKDFKNILEKIRGKQ